MLELEFPGRRPQRSLAGLYVLMLCPGGPYPRSGRRLIFALAPNSILVRYLLSPCIRARTWYRF